MARSEFSRLRGIAAKRLERLKKAGLAEPGISLPKRSDIKSAKELKKATENLKKFLESGTTVKEVKQSRKRVAPTKSGIARPITEKQIKRRQREQKRKKTLQGLTKKQQGLVKAAGKLGVRIPTADIPAFVEYMEYRFSQVSDSQFYIISTYIDDFQSIEEKKPGVEDIISDFNRFQQDREAFEDALYDSPGYTESDVMRLWQEYIES